MHLSPYKNKSIRTLDRLYISFFIHEFPMVDKESTLGEGTVQREPFLFYAD